MNRITNRENNNNNYIKVNIKENNNKMNIIIKISISENNKIPT